MSTFLIALGLSLVGGFGGLLVASGVLLIKDSTRSKLIPWLVSYAVGALLGVSMLALLPTTMEQLPPTRVFPTLLCGILTFFVLEKLVLWRHCHTHDCEVHDGSVVPVLVGDTVPNFVDGAVNPAAVMTPALSSPSCRNVHSRIEPSRKKLPSYVTSRNTPNHRFASLHSRVDENPASAARRRNDSGVYL